MTSRPGLKSAVSTTKFTIDQAAAGVRIDHYLASARPDISRNQLQQWLSQNRVLVNQQPVKKSYRLMAGDIITLDPPAATDTALEPQDLPLEIVYQDDWIAIINKPRHMVVHPAPGHNRGTLVNALLHHFPDLANPKTLRPGIVHRMDKDTTGLLLVTKTADSYGYFQQLFKRHAIERVYWALCHGRVGFDERTIDDSIGRSPSDRKKFAVTAGGKTAVTHLKTLRRWQAYSLLECRLETGRTHQIRVHLHSIHHPIVGDPVYGPKRGAYRSHGQYLHAKRLAFRHPDGRNLSFESELPGDFSQLIDLFDRSAK